MPSIERAGKQTRCQVIQIISTLPHSGAKSTSASGHSGGSGAGQGYPQVLCALQGCRCYLQYGRLLCLSACLLLCVE